MPEEMRRKPGSWVVAGVSGPLAWPKKFEEVMFHGRTLYLTPNFPEIYASICLALAGGEKFEDGQRIIWQFLSALSWHEQQAIQVNGWIGGSYPPTIGKPIFGSTVTDHFDASDIPEPSDEKSRWALAFYREGLSLDHRAYSFLSFYKVINLIRPKSGKEQKKWIADNILNVTDYRAKTRVAEIGPDPSAVADYLYHSNRCAIAHAGDGVTVDPENVEDDRRLYRDTPLIKNLAEIAIERELGIKTAMTIWREHLYELDGFRALLGEDLVGKLKHKGNIDVNDIPPIPNLSVSLKGNNQYGLLQELEVMVNAVIAGVVACTAVSADKLTALRIDLNFSNERLEIDAFEGLFAGDNGTAEAARRAADVLRFQCEYFANGILEVREAATGRIMGRCDAFVPRNVDMGGSLRNMRANIAAVLEEAARREVQPGPAEDKPS